MSLVQALSQQIGVAAACQALGVPRASYYRAQQPKQERQQRTPSPRALSQAEREQVRDTLNSERFQDCAPRQVYAALLDEGQYLCSWRTMYRLLHEFQEVRERRHQLRHPAYRKPELLATGPKQLWSWDITRLKGPVKYSYYYLYTMLDIYSRYVVGWMIAEGESAALAQELIQRTCDKEQIGPGQLTLHADRGSAMNSKPVALLLADLGVIKSHSRPHISNDNPYSESQFKTMKYRPDFPERFGSMQDARGWARRFFQWYNHEHHHSSLGLLTPATVHSGQAQQTIEGRRRVLQVAYAAHPERFVRGCPEAPALPEEVWINKPSSS